MLIKNNNEKLLWIESIIEVSGMKNVGIIGQLIRKEKDLHNANSIHI